MIVDFRKMEELLTSDITQTNSNICLNYKGGSSEILIQLPSSDIIQTNLNICLSYKDGNSEKLISSSLGHNSDKP
jgi:hypothetical protein